MKFKGYVSILALAVLTLVSTSCAVSLLSSEHKHYHYKDCDDKCKEQCDSKKETKLIEIK